MVTESRYINLGVLALYLTFAGVERAWGDRARWPFLAQETGWGTETCRGSSGLGASGRSSPFIPPPDPCMQSWPGVAGLSALRAQAPRRVLLRTACLPWQVSAFSHQLRDRWALECCSQAPWPHSTWRFTHPFLNLILCHFIPLPTQCLLKSQLPTTRSPGPGLPGLPGECSHNWASRQSRKHRLPPWRL